MQNFVQVVFGPYNQNR